jgi:hypothetical protein
MLPLQESVAFKTPLDISSESTELLPRVIFFALHWT